MFTNTCKVLYTSTLDGKIGTEQPEEITRKNKIKMGDDFVKRKKENCVEIEDNIGNSPKLLNATKMGEALCVS